MLRLLDDLKDAEGFEVIPHDGTRYRVFAPDGNLTFVSTNRSNGTALANTLGWAKRHGYDPDAPKGSKTVPPPADPRTLRRRPVAGIASPFEFAPPKASKTPVDEAPEPVSEPATVQVEAPATVEVTVPETAPEAPAPASTTPEPALVVEEPKLAREGQGRADIRLPAGHPALPAPRAILLKKGPGVWQEDRTVDPPTAERFLEYNQDNRLPNKRLIDSWARTMLEGGWVEEIGDPIRFADTGKLLDGQKRLMAVIKSGVPLRFSIITGLPESAQDVMDTGQKRSVSDQLKINGYKNFMIVAASSRLLWLWENGALISGDPAPSNVEQLDFILTLSGEGHSIETSSTVAAGSGAQRIIAPSVLAACHYRMSQADAGAAEIFFKQLSTGAIPSETSPILALRETMRRRRDLKQNVTQAEQVFFVARAWTLWRRGAQVSKLQFPKERLTMQHIPNIV